MKYSIVITSLLLCLGMGIENVGAAMKDTGNQKRIVRSLYEDYINKGKINELNEIISTDYVDLSTGNKGLKVYQDTIRSVLTGFPGIQFTIKDILSEGEKVFVRWQWQGIHQGPFNGIEPTGKKATTNGTAVFEIKGGKVVNSISVIDRLNPLQDLGVVPRDLSKGKNHIYKVDKFVVPSSAKEAFLNKVHETHNRLKEQPGFVRDFILEKSEGPGEFNLVTLVEWENSEAIEKAKQVIKEGNRKSGFDPQEFQKSLGITSDIADYRKIRKK